MMTEKHTFKKQNAQKGQVVLITVLLFLFISVSVVLAFGAASLKSFKNTQDFSNSKQSYFTAESGMEDAAYRLVSGKPTTGSVTLSLNGAVTTTTVTPSGSGNEIVSTGDIFDLQRKVRMLLNPAGSGASYSYGIQVGSGGLTLGNSHSGVYGNVYVNGDISGGSSFITETAVAADKVPMDVTQQNFLPYTPSTSIVFDDANGSQDFAQSFAPATTTTLGDLSFYIKRTSSAPTGTITIYVKNDNGSGAPGATTLATGSFDASITTSYKWNSVTLSSHPTLTKDVSYWIVIDVSTTGSGTKNFILGANSNGYSRGVGRTGKYEGTWNASAGKDAYFRVCMGGTGSIISGMVIGGDAVAYQITNSTVTGTLYCYRGTGNNKGCTATSTSPLPKDFAVTSEMIDNWKAEALAGNEVDGYNIGNSTAIGPKKINGNLTTSNGVVMTVNGTIWITGNYTPGGGNGQKVKLNAAYGENSGVIIVDGKIDLSNNVTFEGSGDPNSFILLLTTNSASDAITVGNNAGAVLLDAPHGTIHYNNNAGANESSAQKIELANGATVTYQTGLVDAFFSSGPMSGGGVSGWREVQ